MADQKKPEDELKELANAAGEKFDADLLILNSEIWSPIDFAFMRQVKRHKARTNLILILVTEGGSSDSAFRIMRALQNQYTNITVIISGWCKSAGTLMCIGANELQFAELGELGPIDVQIVKADEMDEEKSGLATEAAFEKLQQEAFKLFINFVRSAGKTEYRITLKTAAEIGKGVAIGLFAPIFEKLDPVTIGEDYRSNRLAFSYAERLNLKSKNLIRKQDFDALESLLSAYQSHGFVIDKTEAENLFKNVKPLCGEMVRIVELLGADAVVPRNQRQGQRPKLEYLNDERKDEPKAADLPSVEGKPANDPGPSGSGNGTGDVPGNPEEGVGPPQADTGEGPKLTAAE